MTDLSFLQCVIEQASEAMVAVDRQGRFAVWNRAATEVLGQGPIDLPPERWSAHYGLYCPRRLSLLKADELPLVRAIRGEPAQLEILILNPAVLKETRWIVVKARPLKDEEGNLQGGLCIFSDITQSRLTSLTSHMMNWVLNSSDDAIICVDRDGIVVTWNPGAQRIFGYTWEEALGMPVMCLVPPERVGEIALMRQRLMHRRSPRTKETQALDKDGRILEISRTVTAIHDAEGRFLGAATISRDISRRKQAERDLRAYQDSLRLLQARFQSAQEELFRRISRELHDEMGQLLAGIKLDLSWLETKLAESNPELAAQMTAVVGYLDEAIVSVRRIASQMRPQLLEDLGLKAALAQLIEQFERRGVFRARLVAPGRLDVVPDCSLSLFRICQEALTNALRHSQAQTVEVILGEEGEELVLQVCDDGRGFRPEELANGRSLGLLGIRERALLWGGSSLMEALPQGGSRLSVRIPLHRARSEPS